MTIKITRVIANKLTKEIKWNNLKFILKFKILNKLILILIQAQEGIKEGKEGQMRQYETNSNIKTQIG